MDPSPPTGNAPDRRQAEAIAQALLAEGQARQRERLLRRWRMREFRRANTRAALLALAGSAACGCLAQWLGAPIGVSGLALAWTAFYLLGRRWFAPARPARAVIEG